MTAQPAPGPTGRLRYQDLCLDAVQPDRVAPFWAGALGLGVEARGELRVPAHATDDLTGHTVTGIDTAATMRGINARAEPNT